MNVYVYLFKVFIHVSKNIPTSNCKIFNFFWFKPGFTTFLRLCLSNEFLNVLIYLKKKKKTKRKKATLMVSKLGSVTWAWRRPPVNSCHYLKCPLSSYQVVRIKQKGSLQQCTHLYPIHSLVLGSFWKGNIDSFVLPRSFLRLAIHSHIFKWSLIAKFEYLRFCLATEMVLGYELQGQTVE